MWDISKHGILYPGCIVMNDNTPCRILSILSDSVAVEENVTKKLVITKQEFLEPIAITKDILESNYFERIKGSYHWGDDDDGYVNIRRVEFTPDKVWRCWALNSKNGFTIRAYIRYVHQLELIIGIIGVDIKYFVG